MKSHPLLELRNVWKEYSIGSNKVYALRGIDFKINKGEFVAIQGPSGSGKSTCMHLIGCLDTPTKGKIFLDNHDISKLDEDSLAKIRSKKIGFIFQKFNLINSLSAKENIILPMTFIGVSKEKRIRRADYLLKKVGLVERKNHLPTELSGGQQQRIAIARALANDPDIILADEPTGNLDSKMGKIILEFLQTLHDSGKTIIIVTHDDHLAHYAERIEVLKDGKIIESKKGKYFKKSFN